MRIYEVATNVKVTDNGKNYFYWVTVAKPEKAKRAAIKKHCGLMGTNPNIDVLTAEIVPDSPKTDQS